MYTLPMKKLNRYSRLNFRNGQSAGNRIVVPPMASQTATNKGFVTLETINHYKRLAQAKPGILIVEYTFVHSSGRSEENQLGIQSDEHIPGLHQIAKIIHDSGSLAGIQFSHGGGKSDKILTGDFLMAPSAIPVPVKDKIMETPIEMDLDDIQLWKDSFLSAADRAVQAGFDLIEIHTAHGYGLNQWLSPITNQRQDKYGRDLQGRMRLLLEIVELIRAKYPILLISVRMPGQDFLENGLNIEDTIQVAQHLEKAGVDLIHVSSGIGGWRRPTSRNGEGYLIEEAAQIQAQISIPVIGVGGIQSIEFIDKVIGQSIVSLTAIGRAILVDPLGFNKRVLNDRTNKCFKSELLCQSL